MQDFFVEYNMVSSVGQSVPMYREVRRFDPDTLHNQILLYAGFFLLNIIWLAQLARASRCFGKSVGSTLILSTIKSCFMQDFFVECNMVSSVGQSVPMYREVRQFDPDTLHKWFINVKKIEGNPC